VPVPVYADGKQIGQLTSHTFSPLLKKYIGLASVRREYAAAGTRVAVEVTVEYSREQAWATITKLPFFDPARKRE
jgi:aminomethyltransferase